jgi:hypothetical protein
MPAAGLQVQTDVFVGPSAVSILDYVRDHADIMIAHKTHGRSGEARFVPVLLHRPAIIRPPPESAAIKRPRSGARARSRIRSRR